MKLRQIPCSFETFVRPDSDMRLDYGDRCMRLGVFGDVSTLRTTPLARTEDGSRIARSTFVGDDGRTILIQSKRSPLDRFSGWSHLAHQILGIRAFDGKTKIHSLAYRRSVESQRLNPEDGETGLSAPAAIPPIPGCPTRLSSATPPL